MKPYFSMRSGLNKVVPWLWATVWFTLPVSMRANAASLVLFGLAAAIQAMFNKPVIRTKQLIPACLFLLFFAWHAVSLLFDPARQEVMKSLERKLSFVAVPVAMILISGAGWDIGKWAVRGFLAGLAVTGIHLVSRATFHLIAGWDLESVTYHEFTRPYGISAIYYSCYVSAALYLLEFRKMEDAIERVRDALVILLLTLLLFSASKLFIALTIPVILWAVLRRLFNAPGARRKVMPVIVLLVALAGSVPFISRISDLRSTDLKVVTQGEYQYDTPFNGLTFRLVLWKIADDILQEDHAWLAGTGIGSRQEILDEKYRQHGIYTGNPELGDTGYLGYNFHDQYLEVLVGTGIPGLIILLVLMGSIFFEERSKLLFPLMVYVVIFGFFLTESMLERQAGIVFFSLIWTLRLNVSMRMRN